MPSRWHISVFFIKLLLEDVLVLPTVLHLPESPSLHARLSCACDPNIQVLWLSIADLTFSTESKSSVCQRSDENHFKKGYTVNNAGHVVGLVKVIARLIDHWGCVLKGDSCFL